MYSNDEGVILCKDGSEDRSVMYSWSLSFTVDVRGECSREVQLKG